MTGVVMSFQIGADVIKFLFFYFLYNVITLFHPVFEFISAVYVFEYVHIETEINKSHEHISTNIPTKTSEFKLAQTRNRFFDTTMTSMGCLPHPTPHHLPSP